MELHVLITYIQEANINSMANNYDCLSKELVLHSELSPPRALASTVKYSTKRRYIPQMN